MTEEAPLEDVGSGLAPTGPGWFVVNVADTAWVVNDDFGARCSFESSPRVLRDTTVAGRRLTGFTGAG